MAKRIVGAYETSEEAIETIEELETEGYLAENIQILTTNQDADNLKGSTGALVESREPESEKIDKQSLIDKIKNALPIKNDKQDPSDVRKRLEDMGISHEEASKYAPSGKSGSIFILVEENPDGNATGGDTKVKLVAKQQPLSTEQSAEQADDNSVDEQGMEAQTAYQDSLSADSNTEPVKENPPERSTNPILRKMNPPIDEKETSTGEGGRGGDSEAGKQDNPVAPNPPIGGIGDAQANMDTELGHEEGVPESHHRTPLDKTEEDINKDDHDRQKLKKDKKEEK